MKRKFVCAALAAAAVFCARAGAQAKVCRHIDTVLLQVQRNYVVPRFYDYSVPGSGYTVESYTPRNATPQGRLVEAIAAGDIDTVNAILDAGLDVDAPILFHNGTAPLRFAVKDERLGGDSGNMVALAQSVFSSRAYPTAAGEMFGTPLMLAARTGNLKIAKILLERGANPNIFIETKQKYGTTIVEDGSCWLLPGHRRNMIFALKEAYWPLVRCFFSSASPAEFRKTAAKCDRMADLLVSHGASLAPADRAGQNALWDAAEMLSPHLLEMALESGVNAEDETNAGESFVDIFTGMCRAACDDRGAFVCETFREILKCHGVNPPGEAIRATPPDGADDAENDPDFKPVPVKRSRTI